MRTIQTFVLRLLVSSDEPLALRGKLYEVATGEEHPFKDGAALLALLMQMICPGPGDALPEGIHKPPDEVAET